MSNSKHYIWLIGLCAVALWQLPQIQTWPKPVQTLLLFAPYVFAGIGIFISVFLNRIQPIFILLTLAALNFAMDYFFPARTQSTDFLTATALFPLLTLFLPLNLLLWSIIPEKGVYSKPYTLFWLGVFLSQAYGLYWLMDNLPMATLIQISQPIKAVELNLPMIPALVMIGVWLLLVMRNAMIEHPKVLDKSVIFVLMLLAYGLNEFGTFGVLAWLSFISVGLVVLSLVFDSHQIAHTDQLTGLKGRRALLEKFLGLGRKYSIAMMDIDHFKSFNDRYGHDVGDKALKLVANELARVSMGQPYRYGGEEFTLVFAGKTAEQAKPVLEEMRKAIESVPLEVMENGEKSQTKVTVSFGLAQKSKEHGKPEDVMKSADEALYQAKKAGRNRVVVYGEPVSQTKAKPARNQKTKRA
ncbi:MAG: GGDEF domain-containing protein [Hydrogenovibrio sp.]|nr:GGDEF domain-containing protein [Hydrogenovibrio sp.]